MSAARSVKGRSWRLQARLHNRLAGLYARGMPNAPDIELPTEEHGRGGATYAVAPAGLSQSSVVYSFGVGADISFDLSLIEAYGLTVHAFDPTDESARFIAGQDLPPSFHFHQLALADRDGEVELRRLGPSSSRNYLPGTVLAVKGGWGERRTVQARTLETIVEDLGHGDLDVLKLDIEGAEFPLIEALDGSALPARQLVLELHPHLANLERGPVMLGRGGWRRTRAAVRTLRESGYDLFHASDRGTELSFLRRA